MGCICSKLCCDRKNAYKNGKEHLNGHVQQPVQQDESAKVLTNEGNTIDKVPEHEDSGTMNKVKQVEDTKQTSKTPPKDVDRKFHKKKKKKKKKWNKYVDTSSDSDTTSSSSSSSDSDARNTVEKKYKRRDKDGGITKVYSKTSFGSGTKITINKGQNITINNKKTIIKNDASMKKKEIQQLFTQMYDPQSAKKFQRELFNELPTNGLNGDGCFIDLTKHDLVEEVRERELLDKWTYSVGILKSPRGNCTCFRVGSSYIMTALHGIKDMILPEYHVLQNQETDWRNYLYVLNEERVFVNFKHLTNDEHREENKFYFKPVTFDSVPYFDESTDLIVLELQHDDSRPLPRRFSQFSIPRLDKKFSLVHHAGGQPKRVEPVSKVVDLDAERTRNDIQTLKNLTKDFLRQKGKDTDKFKCEIPPYDILVNRDRLLFHCVSNKGASGGPGIQITTNNEVVVVTMLLHGYPDWFYSEECNDCKPDWKKVLTVEQGVNFASIYSDMFRKNPALCANIFCIPRSRTVEALPPED